MTDPAAPSLAPPVWLVDLGCMEYGECWALQQKLRRARVEGGLSDVLLLVEHPPVFTLGSGGKEEDVLSRRTLGSDDEVPLFRVNRGGQVTYHGPGQLVAYAILDLRALGRDVHLHCRKLEEVFARLLARYGLEARRRPRTAGLWVGEEKVLSLGVGARRWVTLHGAAFNVETDLRFFECIQPCGVRGARVTSLSRLLGRRVTLGEVKNQLPSLIEEVLGRELVSLSAEALRERLLDFSGVPSAR